MQYVKFNYAMASIFVTTEIKSNRMLVAIVNLHDKREGTESPGNFCDSNAHWP